MTHWFCLTHMAVEPDAGCSHAERLGPYPDEKAARAALERAHARSEQWDHDPRWSDERDTQVADGREPGAPDERDLED